MSAPRAPSFTVLRARRDTLRAEIQQMMKEGMSKRAISAADRQTIIRHQQEIRDIDATLSAFRR
ncbi:MAG TPA: hypothetical protein VFQ60_01180 [Patescibacteria group bacterium]|nr:hypothetical protein [Patescibacteria group bacterium]